MSPLKSITSITLLLAVACAPDQAPIKSSVDLLTEKPWVYWTTKARMNEGDTWRDLPFTKPDGTWTISSSLCAEDDEYEYRRDGVLIRRQGSTFCSGNTSEILLSTWELLEADSKLRTDFGSGLTDFTVVVLTDEVLKLEFVASGIHVQTSYSHE
jgi:hypothetical protein